MLRALALALAIAGVLCWSVTAGASPASTPSWTIQHTPNPRGSLRNILYGVSCSSATACTAVGYRENDAGDFVPLAEVWNGTTGRFSTPQPGSLVLVHRVQRGHRRVVRLGQSVHGRRVLRERRR